MDYSAGELTFLFLSVGLYVVFGVVLAYQVWRESPREE